MHLLDFFSWVRVTAESHEKKSPNVIYCHLIVWVC